MTMKNVFVSHVKEDEASVAKICSELKKAGCEVRDSSVTSKTPNDATNEAYIKSEILAPCITWAGAVIVAISEKTCTSQWVDWEIEYAEKQGKTIVGVWLPGSKDADLPASLDKYADAIVPLSGQRILDAINGEIVGSTRADGSAREARQIPRHKC